MVGIDLTNNNLFSDLVFFADVYYFNKYYHKIKTNRGYETHSIRH